MTHERSEPSASPEALYPIGRAILERLRETINAGETSFSSERDEDLLQTLYLTDRGCCVPDHRIGEDLMDSIISLYYYHPFDAVREELCDRAKPAQDIRVFVHPDYLGPTHVVMITPTKVLLTESSKPWNFWWSSAEEMAEALEGWYRRAANALTDR